MRIIILAITAILAAGLNACRVTEPVHWTMEEAADNLGLETEYRSTFDSPVQPPPDRPKPPRLK